MSILGLVADIASRQHAALHLEQMRERSVSDRQVAWAVATGVLERRSSAVYTVAGTPRTWRQELMVAVLDAGPGAAVSHRAAAKLLGHARRDAPAVVEISVDRPRSARLPGVIVHRSGDLTAEDVLEVDGIPCTGPLRTLVDLGAVEPQWVVADALERALQSGQVTILGAEWMLTRLSARGRSGCGVFRRVLDGRALTGASPHPGLLEPRMARVLAGMPQPAYQYKVFDETGTFVAQPDFAYPDIKEAIEVDGFEAHGTPEAMTADFEREHRLRAAGWNVTRFTWHHVVRRPSYVRRTVAELLGAASYR